MQDLGRRFGGSKICSMFCCTLFYVHSSFAIILEGKRELVAVLSLSSKCLVIVVWLFLAMQWVCLQFVIVVLEFNETKSVFRLWQNCFLLGSFTCTGLLRCAKYLLKACAWPPDIPHSDYPFKFLDNLFLEIPVQWLVTFLEFFDQISETFGMSTVD